MRRHFFLFFLWVVWVVCGLRVPLVGSNANNEANAGPFYWNANNAASNTNANIGGQLCFK